MKANIYNTQELSDELILQIKNLADGNQAIASDVITKAYNSEEFITNLNVQWLFVGQDSRHSVAGNSFADKHFGSDKSAYERECQALLKRASHDVDLRDSFLQRVVSLDGKGLIEVNSTHTFHDFGTLSVRENCSSCKGRGDVKCGGCGGKGKNKCGSCGGSGRTTRQEAQYKNGKYTCNKTIYINCNSCLGSGKRTCGSCSGRGKVRCSKCSANGYFTLTCHITAQAQPRYAVDVTTDYDKEKLIDLLSSSGTSFCAEKIPFHLVSNESDSDNTHVFSYKGHSISLEQKFELHKKNYTCCAFSNPPYPYARPTIFDDLFADELTYLQTNIPQGKNVKKKKAITFFNRYAGQPVLDEAMRGIAKTRRQTNQKTGDAVSKACHGFISDNMASQLADYLNRLMDKISPAYANIIWWLVGIILFFYSAIGSEEYIESHFSISPIGCLFSSLFSTAIIFLSGAIIAFFLSTIYVIVARRKIPPEYRQKMRHKEPFRRLLLTGLVSFVIASAYGYSASKDWVPKNYGLPLTSIEKKVHQKKLIICEKLNNIQWIKNYCESKPTKILSQDDKVRAIQKTLVKQGYKVSVDGKFGKQTMKVVNKYLKSKNITIKKTNIDEYYRLIIIK